MRATLRLGVALCAGLAACGQPEPERITGRAMGSTYSIKYLGGRDPAEVRAAVERELERFDRVFSTYRPDSEITAFNRHRSTEPFSASEELSGLVARALRLAEQSGGAFDPTVKPLLDVYNRGVETGAVDEAALAAARARVGHALLRVAGTRLIKANPDLQIDPNAIAAGAGVDAVARVLAGLGITQCMVEIGGELLCRGEKAPGHPWTIGIADPERPGEIQARLQVALRDRAMATSGDYRNFFESGGRRWHHIFDPRTGRSADTGVVSVTVTAESCETADALGTTFFVLGPAATRAFLANWSGERIGVYFLLASPDGTLRAEEIGWP